MENFQSEQINELIASLSKAQGMMTGALKDSKNPFFNSTYADLNSVWSACREALSSNNLAVFQIMQKDEKGELMLVTTLGHTSGQWMRSYLPIRVGNSEKEKTSNEIQKPGNPEKTKKANELQQLGSCITYLRRYALAAMVGVAPEEDDGNSAVSYNATRKNSQNNAQICEDDVSHEELMSYLKNSWGDEASLFHKYLTIIVHKKNLNYRKGIEFVENKKEEVQKAYEEWKEKKNAA